MKVGETVRQTTMETTATPDFSPLMIIGTALLGIGFLMMISFWIVLVVKGFKTSGGQGVLVLLLGSLGGLIFACMNWARAGKAFILHIVGFVLLIGGFALGGIGAAKQASDELGEGVSLEQIDTIEIADPVPDLGE